MRHVARTDTASWLSVLGRVRVVLVRADGIDEQTFAMIAERLRADFSAVDLGQLRPLPTGAQRNGDFVERLGKHNNSMRLEYMTADDACDELATYAPLQAHRFVHAAVALGSGRTCDASAAVDAAVDALGSVASGTCVRTAIVFGVPTCDSPIASPVPLAVDAFTVGAELAAKADVYVRILLGELATSILAAFDAHASLLSGPEASTMLVLASEQQSERSAFDAASYVRERLPGRRAKRIGDLLMLAGAFEDAARSFEVAIEASKNGTDALWHAAATQAHIIALAASAENARLVPATSPKPAADGVALRSNGSASSLSSPSPAMAALHALAPALVASSSMPLPSLRDGPVPAATGATVSGLAERIRESAGAFARAGAPVLAADSFLAAALLASHHGTGGPAMCSQALAMLSECWSSLGGVLSAQDALHILARLAVAAGSLGMHRKRAFFTRHLAMAMHAFGSRRSGASAGDAGATPALAPAVFGKDVCERDSRFASAAAAILSETYAVYGAEDVLSGADEIDTRRWDALRNGTLSLGSSLREAAHAAPAERALHAMALASSSNTASEHTMRELRAANRALVAGGPPRTLPVRLLLGLSLADSSMLWRLRARPSETRRGPFIFAPGPKEAASEHAAVSAGEECIVAARLCNPLPFAIELTNVCVLAEYDCASVLAPPCTSSPPSPHATSLRRKSVQRPGAAPFTSEPGTIALEAHAPPTDVLLRVIPHAHGTLRLCGVSGVVFGVSFVERMSPRASGSIPLWSGCDSPRRDGKDSPAHRANGGVQLWRSGSDDTQGSGSASVCGTGDMSAVSVIPQQALLRVELVGGGAALSLLAGQEHELAACVRNVVSGVSSGALHVSVEHFWASGDEHAAELALRTVFETAGTHTGLLEPLVVYSHGAAEPSIELPALGPGASLDLRLAITAVPRWTGSRLSIAYEACLPSDISGASCTRRAVLDVHATVRPSLSVLAVQMAPIDASSFAAVFSVHNASDVHTLATTISLPLPGQSQSLDCDASRHKLQSETPRVVAMCNALAPGASGRIVAVLSKLELTETDISRPPDLAGRQLAAICATKAGERALAGLSPNEFWIRRALNAAVRLGWSCAATDASGCSDVACTRINERGMLACLCPNVSVGISLGAAGARLSVAAFHAIDFCVKKNIGDIHASDCVLRVVPSVLSSSGTFVEDQAAVERCLAFDGALVVPLSRFDSGRRSCDESSAGCQVAESNFPGLCVLALLPCRALFAVYVESGGVRVTLSEKVVDFA